MALSTHTSVSISIISRYLMLALQFASTLILARLLTPEDIGIYTAGFSVVALAHLFRDFGFNQYLIQEKELTKDKIETSFTLSVIISWSLGAALFLSAGLASRVVDEPQVKLLVQLLSANFFIIPFGAITLALLRKALKFHITSALSIVTMFCGIAVTLITAYRGEGYLCLAYGAITETFLLAILSSLFKPAETSLKINFAGTKEILAFGSIVGVANIITQLSETAKNIIITRSMGAVMLGFFSRAEGSTNLFSMIFVNGILPVVLPLYSRLNQTHNGLKKAYYQTCHYAFALAWPFFAFLYFHTDTVIITLYGDQWGEAIALTKILCIGFMFYPPALFVDSLLIANKTPKANLQITAAVNIIQISGIIVACLYGSITDVCMVASTMVVVRTLICMTILRRYIGVSTRTVARIALQNLPCLILSIAPTLVVKSYLTESGYSLILQFSIMLILSAMGWFFSLFAFKHELLQELAKLTELRKSRA